MFMHENFTKLSQNNQYKKYINCKIINYWIEMFIRHVQFCDKESNDS